MGPQLISVLGPIFGKVIGNLFPDPEQQQRAQAELMAQLLAHQDELETAAASIIKAEAASSHWLAANWRPITMLIFVALIAARWLGWVAPNLSEAEYLALWGIVKIGLGGYTFTRSLEKMTPFVTDAIKSRGT